MYKTEKTVVIDGKHFTPELIDSVRDELLKLALMAKAGVVSHMTPCQKLAFELLDKDLSV